MTPFMSFLKINLGWWVVLIGALLVFGSFVHVNDLKRLDITLNDPPSYLGSALGVLLVITGVALTLYKDRLENPAWIGGRWRYEVSESTGKFTHAGDCSIHQTGPLVKVHGIRRIMSEGAGDQKAYMEVMIPWAADWGRVCDDGVLRFEYHIDLPDTGTLSAICRLVISSKKPRQLTGHYYMLPPFPNQTMNTRHGMISMQKLRSAESLLRPWKQGQGAVS